MDGRDDYICFVMENKEILAELKKCGCEGCYYNNEKYLLEKYIPKSKIEEKIKEIKRKIECEENEKVLVWLHKQIRILEELLESEENK